ncbi:MAG: NAD(P)H-hydrate dehydratase [Vulcanimicrobiaceae bacterium]
MPPKSKRAAQIVTVTPAILRRWPLPVPEGGSKDERGRILIIGGAPELPGGAMLAAVSALRAGAGKLQIATCASIAPQVGIAIPEAMVLGMRQHRTGAMDPSCATSLTDHANDVDAVVIGPGMIENDVSCQLLERMMSSLKASAVIDAAALSCIGKNPAMLEDAAMPAALTPHAGEMAALLSLPRKEIESDPPKYAALAAKRFRAVVALKGAQTYIATPSGELFCNREGTIGLATSGSGDTLAGILGGLLARGLPPLAATLWAVYVHAKAGDALVRKIGLGFLAREIPRELPGIFMRINAGH